MNMRIIGIDLAITASHKAAIFDPASQKFLGRPFQFRSRPAELDRVLERAYRDALPDLLLVAILEATGMAWYPVAIYLARHGVKVYRVNGQKTKDFRRALWKHTGSDRIDSRVLTRLYQIMPNRLELCPLPGGDLLALQRSCRAYALQRELDVAEQNRIKAIDQWAWNGLHKLVPTAARSWMRQYWYNPWRVQETGVAALSAAWQIECQKAKSNTDTKWIKAWVLRAEQMTAIYASEEMVGYDHLQKTMTDSLQKRSQYAQEQKRLTQIITPLYEKLYPDCPLPSIQGIGMQSAALYRAFIQDLDRFPTVAQFRSWCGIVPRSKQSGQAEAKGMSLTKAGPNLVKATLYYNSEVARQWDVQFAALYYRLMVEYGKHHSQAVCACASHLASRIYAILKANRPYELRDLKGRPISATESKGLCLQYQVPEKVRQRNNKRFRRNKRDQRAEA